MFGKISKIIVSLSIIFGLSFAVASITMAVANANGQTALAETTGSTKPADMTLKEQTFQVTKYLNLENADGKPQQAQSYFKSANPTLLFLLRVIDLAVKIAGTLAVILMIGTGLTMVMSQGNQNVLEKAKQMFQYEIIGIVVIFMSYIVITFVQSIFTTQ